MFGLLPEQNMLAVLSKGVGLRKSPGLVEKV
jgi:hypothetical protein